jgi:tetratricopeptide (TPR) repeat protein
LSDTNALAHVGELIDESFDASFESGVKRAIFLPDELSKRQLANADAALVEYFRANAWAARSHIAHAGQSWSWEVPEFQEELLALSRAANHLGFVNLDKIRRCQILTNYGNLLSKVGRCIDAIAAWDAALKIIPEFAIALGNRGYGLKVCASMTDDDRNRAILALHGLDSLKAATSKHALFDSGDERSLRAQFAGQVAEFTGALNVDAVRAMQRLNHGNSGTSKQERQYRRWCLEHRLFLSPLNDLGPHLAAASDDLVLPSLAEGLESRANGHLPPPIVGFFSQIKQEYVSARFMLFEGLSSTQVHFSDRGAVLTDTLDYPLYSLASERVRTAFRIAYSLLDKIAFLVDRYWALGKIADRINFKNVWMVESKTRLLPQFEKRENLPLRGLFWLSRELFDDQIKKTTAADARELHSIRNGLEHRYVRVQEELTMPSTIRQIRSDAFGITIGSTELEAKAIRVMRIARSALFYVSFAIGVEERKGSRANPHRVILSMPLHKLADWRKRRDQS